MKRHHHQTRRRSRSSLFLVLLAASCASDVAPPLESDAERTSYAIGLHLGSRLREMSADVDADAIVAGFATGTRDDAGAARLDAAHIETELARLASVSSAATREARKELARRNTEIGARFLAENRAREGVVELPSGVQYRVRESGDQPPPSLSDRVTVEYEGRLLDGAVFDTSRDRFTPTIVRLSRTPAPWREVLPLVDGGATVDVWSPGHLVAAEAGLGLVPPGELVAFTLRVTAIDRHPNPNAARGPP